MYPDSWWKEGAVISNSKGVLTLGYGQHKWKNYQELDLSLPAFYAPDFFLKTDKPWCQFEHTAIVDMEDFPSEMECTFPVAWDSSSQDIFKQGFLDIKKQIAKGDLTKVVLYTVLPTREKMSQMKLRRMLHSALKYAKKSGGQLYGFWNKAEGILGVTPEVLFDVRENTLQTMALAGTKSHEKGVQALLEDPKEQHEHQCVVQGIANSLEPYGKVKIGSLDVMKLSLFNHLITPIEIALFSEVNFETLVEALHPTPALGAYPKATGKAWLEEYSKIVPRGRYGAPFGFINADTCRCLVAIRNIQWDATGLRLSAGCGVVDASTMDKEWDEVQLKFASIKKILGIV